MHTQRYAHIHTHTCMHLQPCTNPNCRKMLMPVIISEPPLSSLQQHSFRGHRSKKESVPSWLLLIGQTARLLPGYQLTLTTQWRMLSISLHSSLHVFFSLLQSPPFFLLNKRSLTAIRNKPFLATIQEHHFILIAWIAVIIKLFIFLILEMWQFYHL